jgi:hypothetical protein
MSAIRKLFEIKKEKVEQENNSNIEDLEKNGMSYFQQAYGDAKQASGSSVILKACLNDVYSKFEERCRKEKAEQEKLKKPHMEELGRNKTEIKRLDLALEIQEDDQTKKNKRIKELNEDIIGVKVNPDKYGITVPKNPKLKFYIGLAILIPITIYLLVFYISASYSVFFKEFENDILTAAIFDPQALTKAYAESWLEVILIITIPFVFLGLGYIIHMMQKYNDKGSKKKIAFLYVITFLFDGLLAYFIEKKIYDFNETLTSPEFNFSIAITKPGFWVIIFAGFVVYIIWGMVFDVIMNEHESLDRINVFINSKKKEKQELKNELLTSTSEVSIIKDKVATLKGNIVEIQSKIDGFIFPAKKYLVYHNKFIKGWLQAISKELALPNKEKDELLERCTVVGEEHLKRLNINESSSQNIIYK